MTSISLLSLSHPPKSLIHGALLLLSQTFLVLRDSGLKHLVLCVHFPSLNEGSSEVLEYTIKEEKSSKYHPSGLACDHTAAAAAEALHPVTTDRHSPGRRGLELDVGGGCFQCPGAIWPASVLNSVLKHRANVSFCSLLSLLVTHVTACRLCLLLAGCSEVSSRELRLERGKTRRRNVWAPGS